MGGSTDESRTAKRTLRAALGTMLAASAAPYGYTVTLWSSGVIVIRSHGLPGVAETLAFAAGALSGFGVMGLLARSALTGTDSLGDAADRVVAGSLHWLAVGAAVGVAALLAEIHGWEVWPLSSLAATVIYLLVASIQLAVVATRRES